MSGRALFHLMAYDIADPARLRGVARLADPMECGSSIRCFSCASRHRSGNSCWPSCSASSTRGKTMYGSIPCPCVRNGKPWERPSGRMEYGWPAAGRKTKWKRKRMAVVMRASATWIEIGLAKTPPGRRKASAVADRRPAHAGRKAGLRDSCSPVGFFAKAACKGLKGMGKGA